MKPSVLNLYQRHHAEKKAGAKHEPLYTLRECCEAAGITYQKYGKWMKKYGGYPAPIFVTAGKDHTGRQTQHYRKSEVFKWIAECKAKETNTNV